MPDGPSTSPRPTVPIPAADALFVDVLRAALRCYELGDYRRAADYFEDAAACAGHRPDAMAWASLGATLKLHLFDGVLFSRDVTLPIESTVRP
jgi:hypothetical protein